jgi:hypothetical protein
MLFQQHILDDLLGRIEKPGVPAWRHILANLVDEHMSEYELYFQFAMHYYPHHAVVENAYWDISTYIPETSRNIYLTCHSHIQGDSILPYLFRVKEKRLEY